jgi:parallel beta-helix repeat protein
MVALAAASLAWAPPAAANHIQCGATISQSTTLDSDLTNCPPPYAVRVTGNGTILDLGGHTIDGTGDGRGVSASSEDEETAATVQNGRVQEFRWGVLIIGGEGAAVRNVTGTDNFIAIALAGGVDALIERVSTTRNSAGSINLSDQVRPVVRRNRIYGNAGGIGGGLIREGTFTQNRIHDNEFGGMGWVSFRDGEISNNYIGRNGTYGMYFEDPSDHNLIRGNDLLDNGGDGLFMDQFTGPNTIEGNHAHRNGDDGLDVNDSGSTLTGNKANRNADLGIEAVPGTIDGGVNKAKRNGNPAQCTGVTCS